MLNSITLLRRSSVGLRSSILIRLFCSGTTSLLNLISVGSRPVSPLKGTKNIRTQHLNQNVRKMFSQSIHVKIQLRMLLKSNISLSDYSYRSKFADWVPQQPDKSCPSETLGKHKWAATLILCIDSTPAKCRKLISHVSLSNCVYGPIPLLAHWTPRTQEVASRRADQLTCSSPF